MLDSYSNMGLSDQPLVIQIYVGMTAVLHQLPYAFASWEGHESSCHMGYSKAVIISK